MSPENRIGQIDPSQTTWAGPSEPQSHTEHQAALEATLFRPSGDSREIVFELDAGELRVRRSAGSSTP